MPMSLLRWSFRTSSSFPFSLSRIAELTRPRSNWLNPPLKKRSLPLGTLPSSGESTLLSLYPALTSQHFSLHHRL